MAKQQQLFFTETDRGHPLGTNALLDKCRLGALRAALTQSEVVLLRTSRIAVSFDSDLNPWILFQEISIGLDALNLLTRDF